MSFVSGSIIIAIVIVVCRIVIVRGVALCIRRIRIVGGFGVLKIIVINCYFC